MKLSATAGLLAAGAVCLALAQDQKVVSATLSEANLPDSEAVSDIARLDGVWRSRGYGWLAEFSDGHVRFFDESANFCAVSATLPDADDLRGRVRISPDRNVLLLPVNDPAYLHTFDRIEALPSRCGQPVASTPSAVLEAMIEAFSTHYAFFDQRDVTWSRLAAQSRRALPGEATPADLLKVMGGLVARLDDAHVSLEGTVDGEDVARYSGAGPTLARLEVQAEDQDIDVDEMYERWERRYWEHNVSEILLDGHGVRTAEDLIAFGMIDGDIGYIAVRAMSGFSGHSADPGADIEALDRAMEEAMTLFRDARAVIVDASINWGGFDTVARALAGRFARDRTIGYYKYAGDDASARPQAIHVEPSKGRRFTGPVYLVTSNVTLSAAEILTMSMRALSNVVHVGETTRGALSDILTKPLPNGWTISLSNEVYLDHTGRAWEGRGIPPQEELTVFSPEDVTSGHVEAIRALVKRISSGE